jgi:hypothetical protein
LIELPVWEVEMLTSKKMLIGVLLCISLRGQSNVSVSPTSGIVFGGISLIGPSDSSFLPTVTTMIDPSELPAFQPILPFSVVVHNGSSKDLIGICVAFEIVDATGKHGFLSQSFETIPPAGVRHPILAAGGSLFVSPERGYSYIAVHSNFGAGLTHPMTFYTSAASIKTSLDSVIFTDGTFVGPDTQSKFAQYTGRLAADRDFANAVLSYKGGAVASLKTFLDGEAVRSHNLSPSQAYQYEYTKERSVRARNSQQTLAKKGFDAVISNALELSSDASQVNLHK